MKLIVGLGNPGREYAGHRHNVGFMAVDQIHDGHDFGPWKSRFQGETSDGRIEGTRVLLLKPQTYMNDSGRSVATAARYLKIALEDVIVFYDEIDLAPSKLKVKTGGGNAGHNGLRSITQHLGNDYQRVRIGVGHPGDKAQVANYVLANFSKADTDWLAPTLQELSRHAGLLVTGKPDQYLSTVVSALLPDAGKATSKSAKPERRPAAKTKSGSARTPAPGSEAAKSPLAEGLKSWFRGGKNEP